MDQRVAPDLLAGRRVDEQRDDVAARIDAGQPGQAEGAVFTRQHDQFGQPRGNRLAPGDRHHAGHRVRGGKGRRRGDAEVLGEDVAEHRFDAGGRALPHELGAEDPRLAHVLVEAIVDTPLDHRVLDARSQAQAAGALHGLDALAPGRRGVAGGGNRRGPPANRLLGALPREHGAERRQEQSERQRREPRTHPSREVRCQHDVFADPSVCILRLRSGNARRPRPSRRRHPPRRARTSPSSARSGQCRPRQRSS